MSSSGPTRRDRPHIAGYGVPNTDEGLLDWTSVRRHLTDALTYWVSSTRPDGRPHSMPTWGIWLDDIFWFEGGLGTRRARNLGANPRAVVSIHVDDDTAIIVEGVVDLRLDSDDGLSGRLVEGFRKYQATRHAYEANPANWRSASGGGLWALRPIVAMAWSDFPRDCTRWHFG